MAICRSHGNFMQRRPRPESVAFQIDPALRSVAGVRFEGDHLRAPVRGQPVKTAHANVGAQVDNKHDALRRNSHGDPQELVNEDFVRDAQIVVASGTWADLEFWPRKFPFGTQPQPHVSAPTTKAPVKISYCAEGSKCARKGQRQSVLVPVPRLRADGWWVARIQFRDQLLTARGIVVVQEAVGPDEVEELGLPPGC